MTGIQADLRDAYWRKSSYSNPDGGNCLEIAEHFPGAARWRKSTYSNGSGGECVEVYDDLTGVVPVRDSKSTDGPALLFDARSWSAFIRRVKNGG
ncbi:DUF397 domain-containing protein [Streptomyces sp. WMMB 322]|uniref:DUF397 domain-containing protein n=1 Tax=Streptomyces sp. WMMB 322 TaxID=1286821 RepID=UPI0006E3D3B3|nr:DUF397 domain-containing protein [Streptomyces sp. WMMB 322]SCK39758.1 protein of unknown function [Streptomyces sp. WMMB 322]